jgi:methanogenic corrinoid protein MtbC1
MPTAAPDHRGLLERCKNAALTYEPEELEAALMEAKLVLSVPVLLEELVTPLLVWIGDRWQEGSARIAHEHLMSATIRDFLAEMRSLGSPRVEGAPAIVVSTPRGHLHETGALMTAILAASEGWRDIYLGPNIPMEEIANTARQTDARAVALSIIYPNDDVSLADDLKNLVRYLNGNAVLLVGGAGSKAYRGVLEELGAEWFPDLKSFMGRLAALREVDDIRDLRADA